MSYHSERRPSLDHKRHETGSPPSQSPHNSSGANTPTSPPAVTSSSFSNSFYNALGGIMRRLSSDPAGNLQTDGGRHIGHAATFPAPTMHQYHSGDGNPLQSSRSATLGHGSSNGIDGVYTPPMAHSVSLLQPPPLEPLILKGFSPDTPVSARILTASIAEEIRIMVPERLRIEEDWQLAYSLDQDGASLATLYEKMHKYGEHRIGFVLAIKDKDRGIFGAYLTERPHPSPHYFGTGECFLWKASLLNPLPPLPFASALSTTQTSTAMSALPTHSTTTAAAPSPTSKDDKLISGRDSIPSAHPPDLPAPTLPPPSPSIRFSAFPYSGVNEYFVYCEVHSLSVGGGDGKYGLWLNDSLDKGISATCLTFGNQPLSDEGEKFGVLGVEVWVIGSRR
ncbi:oxidation resistance protein 1 [Sporothrix epigloea]|uniref:Oxidation resistance protein 1 n=1 Tax=Sporothrix epigloea TaxID=1892477 RepID=A0ABP0E366_9PEZI